MASTNTGRKAIWVLFCVLLLLLSVFLVSELLFFCFAPGGVPIMRPQRQGCLVASTNRGCKAIGQGGGCRAALLKDGITRAPCLRMPDAMAAAGLKRWSEDKDNFDAIKAAFETTTNFGERPE